MFADIKDIEKRKVQEYIEMMMRLSELKSELIKGQRSCLPNKTFNFLEKHITRRKEYKESQNRIKEAQANFAESFESREKAIRELEDKIKKESMAMFGSFSYSKQAAEDRLRMIEKASTFQELGYSSEEEVKKALEEKGIPIRFDSIEEGLELFPETAGRDKKFMTNAINKDCRNIRYDKTDDKNVYWLYLYRKLNILTTQQKQLIADNADSRNLGNLIDSLKRYKSEILEPQEVGSGKYKIPHKFLFEELRNAEQPERENSGSAFTIKYKYFDVDGKFPVEYGKKLEEMYTREDIVFGVHGSRKTEVSSYLQKGVKESTQNNRPRQVDNTVSYEEYLSFTNALDYGKEFSSKWVFILGLPKNAFSKSNPAYIWGSDEKDGTKYILPEYILGYYKQGEDDDRVIIGNNEETKVQYRFLHQDATVDPSDEYVLDTEDNRINE